MTNFATHRRMMPIIAALAVLFLSSCSTDLKFGTGAIYPTSYRSQEGIIVSLPDDVKDRVYKIRVGSFINAHFFKVSVFDAYREEIGARAKGVFRGGVTLTTHDVLSQIQWQDPADGPVATAPSRDVQTILGEMGSLERKELSKEEQKNKSQEKLAEEAIRASSLEMLEQKEIGYLLRFQDAQFAMIDQRATVSFSILLVDWRTKNILLRKRYQGRSRAFDPYNNMKTNEKELRAALKEAFSISMRPMIEDIGEASGALRTYK